MLVATLELQKSDLINDSGDNPLELLRLLTFKELSNFLSLDLSTLYRSGIKEVISLFCLIVLSLALA